MHPKWCSPHLNICQKCLFLCNFNCNALNVKPQTLARDTPPPPLQELLALHIFHICFLSVLNSIDAYLGLIVFQHKRFCGLLALGRKFQFFNIYIYMYDIRLLKLSRKWREKEKLLIIYSEVG